MEKHPLTKVIDSLDNGLVTCQCDCTCVYSAANAIESIIEYIIKKEKNEP